MWKRDIEIQRIGVKGKLGNREEGIGKKGNGRNKEHLDKGKM